MDKLVPMEVSVRQHQLEKKRKKQRQQINQRLVDQYFGGPTQPFERGSAFRDEHMVSAYQQVQTNNARMKDDMVHATSSAPYHKRRKSK